MKHPRPVPGLAKAVALSMIAFCAAIHAQSITSNAVSYGSGVPGPIVQSTTHVAGQTVQQSAQQLVFTGGANPTFVGTASGAASATTEFGLNRAGASGSLVGLNTSSSSAVGWVNSASYSQWSDTWTVTGGSIGDLINVSISGRTTFALTLGGGATLTAPAIDITQNFSAASLAGSGNVSLSNAKFGGAASVGFLDWTTSFSARSGDKINVSMALSASISPSFGGLDGGTTNKLYGFDSTHTALLTSAGLTSGYSLSSASGELQAYDGGFAYKAVLAELAPPVPAVPEPSTFLLSLVGIGLLAVTRKVVFRKLCSVSEPRCFA